MCESAPGIHRTRDLRAAGLRRRDIDTALALGRLHRIRIGVYADPGCCAAILAVAAHGGTPACVTAARHLGLWTLSDPDAAHVWLRSGQRAHHERTSGCRCTEHWDELGPAPGETGVPLRRVLAQILRCRGIEEFFVVLESGIRLGQVQRDDLRWLRMHTGSRGREAIALARADADSGLESLVRWRLRHLDLSIRTQVSVFSVGRVDLVIDDRLLVEVDGRENHESPAMRHKDLVRDANAAAWGLRTLRFDYALVVHDWDLVERAILGALLA